jgi:hypothetical protein
MKKQNSYLNPFVIFLILMFSSLISFSQSTTATPPPPDYSFSTYSLVSGTDKAVGAVYKFTNVKTGFDALVTITNAVNATLAVVDQTGTGWNAAFQPSVTVNTLKTGYIDFRIDFVLAGTNIAAPQPQVAITALDIDGFNYSASEELHEFDQFDMGPNAYAEYNFMGTDIKVNFAGTAVKGTNVAGIEYVGINLSPNVMFTAFKSTVSTIFVRSGAINKALYDVTRQRSLYFARFPYPASIVLAATDLKAFNGNIIQKRFAHLNWELAKNNSIEKIDIEHSTNAGSFEVLQTISKPQEGVSEFTDCKTSTGNNYYRIKLYEASGKFNYSNTIKIVTVPAEAANMQIFPVICNTKTSVSLTGQQKCSARLELKDYNGRLLISKPIIINKGNNLFDVELNTSVPNGTCIVSIITDKQIYSSIIIKTSR